MSKKEIKKLSGIFYIILILLVIALLVFIGIHFKVFEKKQMQRIQIIDECSVMMNDIIHLIKNEGNCRLMCLNECNLRDLKFIESEFIERTGNCNECYCSCR